MKRKNLNLLLFLISIGCFLGLTRFDEAMLLKADKKYFKIAIIGAHGTGKTTILKGIQKQLNNRQDIQYIDEVFRKVFKRASYTHRTEHLTLATYAQQLAEEELALHNKKHVIVDRSVFDAFIYGEGTSGFYKDIKKQAKTYLKTYDYIILIEPSERIVANDGFRFDVSKAEQKRIHNLFLQELKDINHNRLIIVNQEQQKDVIKWIVNSVLVNF
jgi:nicotinamide riboside kinase